MLGSVEQVTQGVLGHVGPARHNARKVVGDVILLPDGPVAVAVGSQPLLSFLEGGDTRVTEPSFLR